MTKQKKRYSVFVSSTFKDLKKERAEILKGLVSIYCIPLGMEYFDASDTSQFEIIKENINESDYYVLIIGGRYGTPFDDNKSYTMMEYEYAVENGVPILAFIRNEESIPKSLIESDKALLAKLRDFKNEVSKTRVCYFWDKKSELVTSVSRSLLKEMVNNPRPGWKRCKTNSKKVVITNNIIIDYLELCKSFRDAEIWLDPKAIDKFEKSYNYTWEDSPILLLYEPIYNACVILDRIKSGEYELKDKLIEINHIAGEIWYAIDCRMDVKELTTNSSINAPSKIINHLIKHYKFVKDVEINRSFLRDVSGEVWEELGGDI